MVECNKAISISLYKTDYYETSRAGTATKEIGLAKPGLIGTMLHAFNETHNPKKAESWRVKFQDLQAMPVTRQV
jgi:hypothetical protein